MTMQFNSKDAKNFRDTLALWHIADFKKADADITRNKFIAGRQTMIDTDKERLGKIEAGDATLGNKADIEAEIAKFEAEIKAERERVAKIKAEYDKSGANGLKLITTELQTALEAYVADCYKHETHVALAEALVKWFTDNGVKGANQDAVQCFIRPLGVKRASAKVKCATNAHITADKKKSLAELFLGIVCEEPTVKAMLPTHKWENKIAEKTRKK